MINAGDVVLKRWEPEWAADLAEVVRASLAQLRPFMPWAHDHYDVADARAFIELSDAGWRGGTAFQYAAFTAVGDLIGSAGLMTRMGPGILEIGYWIRTDQTGKGFATTLAAALARVALDLPDIERVAIRHDAANAASGRVAAKAGFTEAARVPCDPEAPGESGLHIVWERGSVGRDAAARRG
ncbi:GNAT family N-acetyltransferase [Plantactinospora sp. KBS50]|nr:GNAT family N-acetyltransferase [Plantactinospora sp. KBS50]